MDMLKYFLDPGWGDHKILRWILFLKHSHKMAGWSIKIFLNSILSFVGILYWYFINKTSSDQSKVLFVETISTGWLKKIVGRQISF